MLKIKYIDNRKRIIPNKELILNHIYIFHLIILINLFKI